MYHIIKFHLLPGVSRGLGSEDVAAVWPPSSSVAVAGRPLAAGVAVAVAGNPLAAVAVVGRPLAAGVAAETGELLTRRVKS